MRKKKRSAVKITILVIVVLVAVALGAFAYYLYDKVNSGLFFKDTKINGYDVSGKTCKEVLLMLKDDYEAPKVTITEKGEKAEELSLEEMGYTIDEMELLGSIQSCMRDQNIGLIFSLMDGNEFEVDVPFEYDDATFKKAVSSANFAAKRVKSTDAEMKYNGTEYYIEPETYGNEFDDADLQVMVKDTVDQMVASARPQPDMEIALPESFYYLPDVMRVLMPGGVIISDNILQEGEVLESHFLVEKRNRTIHDRMREYLDVLTHDERLETAILPVGDGMAISILLKNA